MGSEVAMNNIKKQKKFYSLPKRYNEIQRFEQWPSLVSTMGPCVSHCIV
jgi:hypothetical protein